MNPRLDHQGCLEAASYCRYGSQTLLRLLPTLESQAESIKKGEDVEYVHKTRVASRRIRAALPLFKSCFPKKNFRKWLKQIKRVTRFLGEARDLDVQIIFTQDYLKTHSTSKASGNVKFLLEDLTNRRANVQAIVPIELEKLKTLGILEEITRFCTQALAELSNEPFYSQAVLQEAYWHISTKIDEFLAMEYCVHKEDDVLNHHKMRIRAKWLRYTMEAFSSLYTRTLSNEIKLIKRFQDILGEMHDCDVWIEFLPKPDAQITVEHNTEDKTLSEFLEFVKQRRRALYGDFVQLWDQKKTKDAFEQIRRNVGMGLVSAETTVRQALQNTQARIGVLADVHGNLQALKAVFQNAEQRGISIFLNAGDLTGFGAFPNEVIQLLNTKKTLSVIGNFDLEVLGKAKKGNDERKLALKYARKELGKPCKKYLKSLPNEITLETADKKLLVVHGSPVAIDEHIYKDTPSEKLAELGEVAQTEVVIVGHSHEQFLREANGVSFINPGSVGRPYDGNPKAAYAIVAFNPLAVEFIRVDYDVKAAASALRHKKLPESFAQMLLRGLSLDTINEEDQVRNREMEANCQKMEKTSTRLAEKYLENTNHPGHVRSIALKIFDDIENLHHLGKRERCWLDCAALLHDIGLSMGTNNHNKNSLKLILDDAEMPFSSEEKRIIGSIARYHRKGGPKENHYNLACLGKEIKLKIKILSSILRVADALDFTHQSIVDQVIAKAGPKKINIECVINANPTEEKQVVDKKKDLLEEVFEKKLVLTWKKK
jgi:putative phosphoesterase